MLTQLDKTQEVCFGHDRKKENGNQEIFLAVRMTYKGNTVKRSTEKRYPVDVMRKSRSKRWGPAAVTEGTPRELTYAQGKRENRGSSARPRQLITRGRLSGQISKEAWQRVKTLKDAHALPCGLLAGHASKLAACQKTDELAS
eukprot:3275393-Pleurochrysis_carterae.AAC.4